jgi:N-methylhydantoinase A/oxoprolinase/acetone carboxylase beta subunit
VFRERTQNLWCEASRAQQLGMVEAALRALADGLRQDLLAEGQNESGTGSHPLWGGGKWQWSADLRYDGQSHSLTLPGLGEGGPAPDGKTDLVVRFHQEHARRYGYTIAERPVQLERVCVRVTIPIAAPAFADLVQAARAARAGARATAPTAAWPSLYTGSVPVLHALKPGSSITGPALLEGELGPALVPAGWRATAGTASGPGPGPGDDALWLDALPAAK